MKVYSIVSPAIDTVVGLADLVIDSAGDWVTSIVTEFEVSRDVGAPRSGPRCASEVSTMEPWSTSAWVTA